MAESTQGSWNILVVDDEDDVHAVTELALKRQTWRGRPFSITRAVSAKEAKQILSEQPPSTFHVAMIDVVMESDSAGLELCDYIRSKLPLSLRIILRTGQPGVAPEERVVEDFEIDHYLPKVDATADRIHGLIVATIRSSIDVRMVLALSDQLESFAQVMEAGPSELGLDKMLGRGLSVVEWKHRAPISFYSSLEGEGPAAAPSDSADAPAGKHREALLAAHKARVGARTLHNASKFGLSEVGSLIWIDSLAGLSSGNDGLWSRMKRALGGAMPEGSKAFGLVIEPGRELSPKSREALERDLAPFTDNWKTAQRVMSLQEGVTMARSAQSFAKVAEP